MEVIGDVTFKRMLLEMASIESNPGPPTTEHAIEPDPIDTVLKSAELKQYLDRFNDQEITGNIINDLTDADIKDIGVVIVGHRVRIRKAIKAYQARKDKEEYSGPHFTHPPQLENEQDDIENSLDMSSYSVKIKHYDVPQLDTEHNDTANSYDTSFKIHDEGDIENSLDLSIYGDKDEHYDVPQLDTEHYDTANSYVTYLTIHDEGDIENSLDLSIYSDKDEHYDVPQLDTDNFDKANSYVTSLAIHDEGFVGTEEKKDRHSLPGPE